MINECKTEEKECFAFRIWVNNGGELNEKQQKKWELDLKILSNMGLTMTLTFL